MRGQEEPQGWEDRFDISRENWHESFLLYERDLRIQEDLEWFVEAVFVFYTKHLDKLIRENGKLRGVEVEEEEQEPPEPKVPAPTQVNMECQTDESFLSGAKSGSSLQKEEPVPPEGSLQKEESGETKPDVQTDDTAPKQEPAKRLYYNADITGNDDDSVF